MPSKLPDALKSIDVKALLRRRGVYHKQIAYLEVKEAALPLARQIIEANKSVPGIELAKHPQFTNEQIEAYIEKQLHIVHVIEDKFDRKLQQFITKMVDGYLGRIESEIVTTKNYAAKDYFSDNEDELRSQAQLDFTPLLESVSVAAGTEALKLIGSRDVYLLNLKRIIADNVAKFTQSMIDTDRDHLTGLIANGIENGASIPEIRNIIEADFENITKSQAGRITKTEVSRVSIQSAKDAWRESGVVEGLQWIVVSPIDECADYANQVRALDGSDGSFYDIENDFQDGDPPLHPNCECELVPVLIGGEKSNVAQSNELAYERIKELEDQIDKRTKDFKELKSQQSDDSAYIKSLEKYLGVDDGS